MRKERIHSSFARTKDTPMVALVPAPGQLPLIQFVESDDLYLQDQPDVLWFDVLPNLDYRRFRQMAPITTNASGSSTNSRPSSETTTEKTCLPPTRKRKPKPHSG